MKLSSFILKSTIVRSGDSTDDLEVPLLVGDYCKDGQHQLHHCCDKEFKDESGMAKKSFSSFNEETVENSSLSTDAQESREGQISRNIPLIIAYTYILQTSRSLWSLNILSSYVYLLENKNAEAVGFITAVMGMSQFLAAFPAGHAADTYGRDGVLRIGAAVGIVAILSTCYAVYQQHYYSLVGALAASGLFLGITSPSILALLADSTKDGERAKYFTHNLQVTRAGQTIGPLLALVLFSFWADTWSLKNCSWVLVIGQFCCVPAVALLCCMKDEYSLDHLPSKHSTSTILSTCNSYKDDDEEQSLIYNELESPHSLMDISNHQVTTPSGALEAQQQSCQDFNDEVSNNTTVHSGRRFISYAVAISDTTHAIATGMTIRYFPIFFMNTLQLHPTQVQILYILGPLGQIVAAHYAQQAGKKYGLLQTAVFCRLTGIIFMLAMIFSYQHIHTMPFDIQPSTCIWLTCILYLVRNVCMNCTQALTQSVLMDSVPKEERGKWSALESFNTAAWSGSSFIGGILVGRYGISANFYVTSVMQCMATLPLMMLFNKVLPSIEKSELSSSSDEDEKGELRIK